MRETTLHATQRGSIVSKTWKTQERKLAKLLDSWWGTDKEFRRTPMSGAWDKRKFGGDIVTPADCPFIFEMKTEDGWEFRSILSTKSSHNLFISATKQVLNDAKQCRKLPVLVFTSNNIPVYFGFPSGVWQAFVKTIPALYEIPFLHVYTGKYHWTFVEGSRSAMKESKVLTLLPKFAVNLALEDILHNEMALVDAFTPE